MTVHIRFSGFSEMWACPDRRGLLCWQVKYSLATTSSKIQIWVREEAHCWCFPSPRYRRSLSPQSGPHSPAHLLASFSPWGCQGWPHQHGLCQGGQWTPYWLLRTSREALGLGAAYFSWISKLAVKTQMEKATWGWRREVKIKDEGRDTKTASSPQGNLCLNPDIIEMISHSCFHRILPTSLATGNVLVTHPQRLMQNTCKGD